MSRYIDPKSAKTIIRARNRHYWGLRLTLAGCVSIILFAVIAATLLIALRGQP